MATINVTTQSATVVDSGSDKKVVLNETSNTTSGTNTFAIQDSAAAAKVLLRGSGDTVLIEGLSAEYQVKANGKTVTLKSADQTITIVLNSLTKTTPTTAKLVFLDGELSVGNTSGSSVIKLGDQSLTKKYKDLSATPADSASASNYFDDSQGTPTGGSSLKLTVDSDTLEGDAGNNTFKGRIGTVDGLEANTLNSGDSIDGRDGTDTLQAQVFAGGAVGASAGTFFGTNLRPIQPEIQNVEIIKLEAQYRDIGLNPTGTDSFGGAYGEDTVLDDIYVRASEMTDVDQLWSYNSTGDLIIQDLTTLESNGNVRNTKDMTIGMAYTGNSDHQWDQSDYKVYFDQDYLIPRELNEGSQLFIELMDMDSALTDGPPLLDNPFGQIVFTIGGVQKTLNFGTNANTYAELLTDIQTAIAAKAATDPAFAKLTASFGPAFTATDTDTEPGGSTQGTSIVITNSGPEPLAAVSMTATGTQPAGKDFHTGFSDSVPGTQAIPVEINIALEKAGDSGDGGNLVIGSMNKDEYDSNSIGMAPPTYNDTVAGFEKFNVTVYGNAMKPSSLASLRSTNNTLETVIVTSETRTDDSYADLIIGNRHATYATDYYGLKDVQTFDSSTFKGDATIDAGLTDEMDDKYGNGEIDVAYTFGIGNDSLYMDVNENQGQGLNVAISMGEGDDLADIWIDGDTVDAVTESFSLDLGNGNNTAIVGVSDGGDHSGPDADGVSLDTTAALQNLSITSGSGDDHVTVYGNGQFDIHVGAGSDFVMIDAGGSEASQEIWAPSESGGGYTFDDVVLYQAKLSIRYAGFESTVAIDAGSDFIATQRDINNAIIKAIDANPELKRMLETEIGTTDQDLLMHSLIDGNNAAELIIYQPEVIATGPATAGQVIVSSSHVATLKASLIATGQANDSLDVENATEVAGVINTTVNGYVTDNSDLSNVGPITDMAGQAWHRVLFTGGTEGGQDNNSHINMGTGSNDLVVLSSEDDSSNTLEFTAAWGKVSVVNWFSDEDILDQNTDNRTTALNGDHQLDFTTFLTTESTSSGSTESETVIPYTVEDALAGGTITVDTNEIVFVDIDNLEATTGTPNLSFSSLTAAQVASAMNALGGGTNFVWADETVSTGPVALGGNGTGLAVGTTVRTALLFVENVDTNTSQPIIAGADTSYENYGDYKVYQVTFGTTGATANSNGDAGFQVSYLGQIDFGNSLELGNLEGNLVNGFVAP